MASEHVDVVLRSLEAHNAGDVEGVLLCFDPEIELIPMRSLLDGSSYHGHEGYRRFIRDVREEWGRVWLEPDEVRDLGDRVLLLGRFHGHGQASGVDFEAPAAWTFELRDGRIARLRAYSTQEEALAAVGATPEPSL